MQSLSELQYPIGTFVWSGSNTPTMRQRMISSVESIPRQFADAVGGLSDEQLDTPYREDGWTVRQVVHHVADSHMQAYSRVKLALTEDVPTIRPYDEAAWARLVDSRLPVGPSLEIISGLHARWAHLMRSFTDADWSRALRHPERGVMSLDLVLALYHWHGEHHLAHIAVARRKND